MYVSNQGHPESLRRQQPVDKGKGATRKTLWSKSSSLITRAIQKRTRGCQGALAISVQDFAQRYARLSQVRGCNLVGEHLEERYE